MNRADLQRLFRLRIQKARSLLRAGLPNGAYYLAGYSVECAIKACIARETQSHDFPDKERVQKSYTHKPAELLRVANLYDEFAESHRRKCPSGSQLEYCARLVGAKPLFHLESGGRLCNHRCSRATTGRNA